MPTQLQLSQTAVPFPYGVLAASTFVNSQEDIAEKVELSWERDGSLKFAGKDATDADVLAQIGKSLKGQQVSHIGPSGCSWLDRGSEGGRATMGEVLVRAHSDCRAHQIPC